MLGAQGIYDSNIRGRRGRRPSWIVMRVTMGRQRYAIRAGLVRRARDLSFEYLRTAGTPSLLDRDAGGDEETAVCDPGYPC